MKYLIILLLSVFIFYGCDLSCDDLKSEVRNQYGQPEEISSYNSGDYSSEDWWYWSKGIEFTFTQSSGEPCEKSTYTFSPIYKPTAEQKINVSKKLINKEYSKDCPTCP